MQLSILAFAAALFTSCPSAAQCPITTVDLAPFGTGCSGPFPGQVPKLAGVWVANSCSVSLWMNPYPGCCNTFLREQIFAFGPAPANVPVPALGTGCTLLTAPLVLLPVDRSVRVVNLKVPATATLGTVYVQGVLRYFTTINQSTGWALSQGLRVTLR